MEKRRPPAMMVFGDTILTGGRNAQYVVSPGTHQGRKKQGEEKRDNGEEKGGKRKGEEKGDNVH